MGSGVMALRQGHRVLPAAILFAVLLLAVAIWGRATPTAQVPDSSAASPVAFVPNRGQADPAVRFAARGPGFAFHFTPAKVVLDLQRGDRGVALHLRFRGANRHPAIVPERRAPGRVNYISGAERHTDLPLYHQLRYKELWPGIDMVFRGSGGQLKYEFVVRPGADPRDIRLAYAGADSMALGRGGALLVGTPLGTLSDQRPRSFQGSTPVASRYTLAGSSYGFALGSYDRTRLLVIDPGLVYSTYLGGDVQEHAYGVDIDSAGNAYVVGDTDSTDFPTTPGAYDTTDNERKDAFVTKFDPSGALVYSTLLGGKAGGSFDDPPVWEGDDYAMDVEVDQHGNAYVMGATGSIDFPTTPGAYLPSNPGDGLNAYVTKLDSTGSTLLYSTPVGGAVTSTGTIDVDGSGHAYIGGQTFDTDYPTTPGAYRNTPASGFVTKLNPGGTALEYSTYFEAPVNDLRVDDQGHAVFTGRAGFGLPTTPGAYDTTHNGDADAYVTKLNSTGGGLVYSTYLGGTSGDQGNGIALDSDGNVYVTGHTRASNFPTTAGAYSTAFIGHGFATKLNSTGSALVYSTFLAGNEYLGNYGGIDVDSQGSAYVTGVILDTNLDTTPDAYDPTSNGNEDAYLVKLTPSGSDLAYATYLGGSARDWGYDVAAGDQQNAVVAGDTSSTDYPTTPGAAFGDAPGFDAFVTKINTTPFSGYPRPKGASPARFSLTIAYEQCTDPNEIHGPPLAFGSCAAPQMASDFLTVGTGDSNGKPARNEGHVRLGVLAGNPATPADEADVAIDLFSDDIFTKAFADYAGELRATFSVRITDRDNTPSGGGSSGAATTADVPLGATFGCAPTADPQEGSSCSASTSLDALIPGAIKEGKRSIWQLDRIRVFDGGADGDGDTVADNTLFATQGVFIP